MKTVPHDSFSNIATEYPQGAITAPHISSVVPTVVSGQAGLLFTYTGRASASFSFFDAAGTYVGPQTDPTLGSASAGTTSAFLSYDSIATNHAFYPPLSGKFVMVATGLTGSSNPSNVVDISTPSAPTTIAATALSNGAIGVTWTNTAFNATGYNIQRSSDGGITWTTLNSSPLSANTESYQDTTALAGTNYLYQVAANGTNDSGTVSSGWNTLADTTSTTEPEQTHTVSPRLDTFSKILKNGGGKAGTGITIITVKDKTTGAINNTVGCSVAGYVPVGTTITIGDPDANGSRTVTAVTTAGGETGKFNITIEVDGDPKARSVILLQIKP